MTKKEELLKLYTQNSKHSNYQILSKKLSEIIDIQNINTRYEQERLESILEYLPIEGREIIDIGGNSGYFTFELIEHRAKHVSYYEGNKIHANFVKLASEVLEIEEKITVFDEYFSFIPNSRSQKYDIAILLNVLHHIGDDYGDKDLSLIKAKEEILKQLNNFATRTSLLVFQLGFNWKGNRDLCLFESGTKSELIKYIEEGVKDYWDILHIKIAEKINDKIIYKNFNQENSKRDDSLGEFLNRPLFIMKSKHE